MKLRLWAIDVEKLTFNFHQLRRQKLARRIKQGGLNMNAFLSSTKVPGTALPD